MAKKAKKGSTKKSKAMKASWKRRKAASKVAEPSLFLMGQEAGQNQRPFQTETSDIDARGSVLENCAHATTILADTIKSIAMAASAAPDMRSKQEKHVVS